MCFQSAEELECVATTMGGKRRESRNPARAGFQNKTCTRLRIKIIELQMVLWNESNLTDTGAPLPHAQGQSNRSFLIHQPSDRVAHCTIAPLSLVDLVPTGASSINTSCDHDQSGKDSSAEFRSCFVSL